MQTQAWKGIYIGAICLIVVGLFGIISANYLLSLVMFGGAAAMFFVGANERKKAERIEYKEDNPHSTALPVLYDDKILNLLEEDKKYDPTNIQLNDLQTNFLLDYNLQNWSVFQVAIDYWQEGNLANTITKRAVLKGPENTAHLTIDNHKVTEDYPLAKVVNIYTIDKNIDEYIEDRKLKTPATLNYHGEVYYREPINEGLRINPINKTYQSIESADYLNEARTKIIQLQLTDGVDLDAFVGEMVMRRKFGNIIPSA